MYIGLCAKGADFSADIAQAGGERAPGRSQLLAMFLMSVDFPLSRFRLFRVQMRGFGALMTP